MASISWQVFRAIASALGSFGHQQEYGSIIAQTYTHASYESGQILVALLAEQSSTGTAKHFRDDKLNSTELSATIDQLPLVAEPVWLRLVEV